MNTVDPVRDLPFSVPHERGDAARNRVLLLDAARRLIDERGADAVTMDDIAGAAGVGKGTVFRRFGSRAGLMMVLLDEDERASQQAFMFGPATVGPRCAAAGSIAGIRARTAAVHPHPPRVAVGRQSRSAGAVRRRGHGATHPRPDAPGLGRNDAAIWMPRPMRYWPCWRPTTSSTS